MPETVVAAVQNPAALTLQDRVQALRLPDKVDQPGRSGGGWLPWGLCLLLALTTVSLAARSGNAPSTPTREGEAAAESKESGSAGASPSRETRAATPGAPGSVALESKGYIIPAHQI